MQLRAHTRLPGRYREDDISSLPGRAKFVHPTIPYNPNLPPAAFPTLEEPRPVQSQAPYLMDVGGTQPPDSQLEEEPPRRPATVFRGKGKTARTSSSSEQVQHEPEEGTLEPSHGFRQPQFSFSSEDPGDFETNVYYSDGEGQEKKPRVGLTVSIFCPSFLSHLKSFARASTTIHSVPF